MLEPKLLPLTLLLSLLQLLLPPHHVAAGGMSSLHLTHADMDKDQGDGGEGTQGHRGHPGDQLPRMDCQSGSDGRPRTGTVCPSSPSGLWALVTQVHTT